MEGNVNSKISLIHDLSNFEINSSVTISGRVIRKKEFQNLVRSIVIQDITGSIRVLINIKDEAYNSWVNISKNQVVKLNGKIGNNSKGFMVIENVISIITISESFFNSANNNFENEYAGRVLLSKVIDTLSSILKSNHFQELNTRLISSSLKSDSLEPLTVSYPGFGTSAFLMTSPSTQLLQFITESYVPSAYSISKSFSSSYRFPNGSTELNVVVGKTIQFDTSAISDLLTNTFERFLKDFRIKDMEIVKMDTNWPDNTISNDLKTNQIGIVCFDCNLPVVSEKWESNGIFIFHVIGFSDILFSEVFVEKIVNSETLITTLTFYPDQILSLIQKSPRRHLQNLVRIYE